MRPSRPSAFMGPIIGSIADRRLTSRLIVGVRPRRCRVMEAKAQLQGVSFGEMEQAALANAPTLKYVTAQQLADQIAFLCSPRGRTISGQAIAVDVRSSDAVFGFVTLLRIATARASKLPTKLSSTLAGASGALGTQAGHPSFAAAVLLT